MFSDELRAIRDMIYKPVLYLFIKLGLHPNWITLVSGITGLATSYFMYYYDLKWALAMLIVGRFADGMDGLLARSTN